MIKCKDGIERFSLNQDLYNFSQRIRQKINEDDAMVLGIIWGDVGCGKSVFAQHLGYAIDPTLDITRVCFDKEEFTSAVVDNEKKVIIGDEGISLFFSRAAMTKEGRLINELMAQCRQKNHCMLICVPEILSVDWLTLNAADFVAYCWESREKINSRMVTIKGNVMVYPEISGNKSKTRILHYLRKKRSNPYIKGRRPYPLIINSGNPKGDTFKEPWYPVGEKEYRKKKEDILKKYDKNNDDKKKKPTLNKQQLRVLIKDEEIWNTHQKHPDYTIKKLAEIHNVTRKTASISLKRSKMRVEGNNGN